MQEFFIKRRLGMFQCKEKVANKIFDILSDYPKHLIEILPVIENNEIIGFKIIVF